MNEHTSDEFYDSLITVIENGEKKIKQNGPQEDLSSVRSALSCIRNSFHQNVANQTLFAKNEQFRRTLIAFMETLIKDVYPSLKNFQKNQEVESSFNEVMSLCITTFVNMLAGNSAVREIMWPLIKPFIKEVISFNSSNVNHLGAALLHQFLLEENLKEEILRDDLATCLILSLLKSYLNEGPHSCFSLFCLEVMLKASTLVSSIWEQFSLKESLLLLDILMTLLQKEAASISLSTINFMQELFKKDADRVFALHDDRVTLSTPIVTIRVTSFLSSAAASDCFRAHLQKDKSLLISSVYLLKGITDIGDSSKNVFSRVQDNEREGDLESHPVFGFKSDLIRLIAGLVFRNRENQDTVREIDGILLLLENSQFDARNPLIREASIFALRNLLEGNAENQEVISSLQMQGVAENECLGQIGLVATVNDGKLSLLQK